MYISRMRRTYALVQVSLALMDDAGGRHWGYELSRRSGVRSPVMYRILHSMLDEGWLTDGWEEQAQIGRAKRPPRRYYELTDTGKAELGAVITGARQDARFRALVAPQIAGIPT
jgi:PadR family transcriptional regulator, regulatory protein PadR